MPSRSLLAFLFLVTFGVSYMWYKERETTTYYEKWDAWVQGKGPHPDPEGYFRRMREKELEDASWVR